MTPRPFEHKRVGEQHQKQMIVEERWLVCGDGDEFWSAVEVKPSLRVHLVRLPWGRLIQQTYTYVRYAAEDNFQYDGQIVTPPGAGWEYYGTDASGDRNATSAIWRRKHDPKKWEGV